MSLLCVADRTVLTKFAVTVHWQYSSIQFALAPRKKMCPTNELIQVNTNVSVPCVVDLLETEYRPLPVTGVGATHGLPSITVRPENGIPFYTVQSGTGQKNGGHPQQMPTTQILSERKTSMSSRRIRCSCRIPDSKYTP